MWEGGDSGGCLPSFQGGPIKLGQGEWCEAKKLFSVGVTRDYEYCEKERVWGSSLKSCRRRRGERVSISQGESGPVEGGEKRGVKQCEKNLRGGDL